MLINFRVENFLSFDQVSTFSMTTGKTKLHQKNIIKTKDIDLLKFAAVYGANASGKSNFVTAISFSQIMILNGIKEEIVSNLYNRNKKDNSKRKTRFEYELKINDKIYSYGFSMDMIENKFSEEWLYDITDDEKLIFTRGPGLEINFDYLNFDESSENRLKVYADDTISNDAQLFITALNKDKNKIISKDGDSIFTSLFEWFRDVLEVISPDEATSDFAMTYKNEKYLNKLSNYLKLNDTGINRVLLEKTDGRIKGMPIELEKKIREKILSDMLKNEDSAKRHGVMVRTSENIYTFELSNSELQMFEIKFEHGDSKIKYSLNEESDGTVRLIELFSVLFSKKEKVFIIDELDRSLHPLLTYNFVQSFLDKEENSQLIVTTHEDRLLDLSLLRRDEIWFVKKDNDGDSQLYSLEEFKERFDKNIMNAYLDGRYGGTPKIRNLFSMLQEDEATDEGN